MATVGREQTLHSGSLAVGCEFRDPPALRIEPPSHAGARGPGRGGAPHLGAQRCPGIHQPPRCPQRLAAGAGAATGDRPARGRLVQARQPGRRGHRPAALRCSAPRLRRGGARPFAARRRLRPCPRRRPHLFLRRFRRLQRRGGCLPRGGAAAGEGLGRLSSLPATTPTRSRSCARRKAATTWSSRSTPTSSRPGRAARPVRPGFGAAPRYGSHHR